MWLKNLFPNPSPLCAPAINPAISTNSTVAGIIGGLRGDTSEVGLLVPSAVEGDSSEVEEATISASFSSLSSGTGTIPTFGSIVAKGKLATYACCFFKRALNSVLLPTFGRPTIPTDKFIIYPEQSRRMRRLYQNLLKKAELPRYPT